MAYFNGVEWRDSDSAGGHSLVTPDYWMEVMLPLLRQADEAGCGQ